MSSVRQQYQVECKALGIKANSAVQKQLPEGDGHSMTAWDLSGNLIGTKGFTAVVRVAATLPKLQILNVSNNNIASTATSDLLKYLSNHPSLLNINLSKNDIRLGGPDLVEFLKRNKKILQLNIDDTFLRPLFVNLAMIQIRKNGESAGLVRGMDDDTSDRSLPFTEGTHPLKAARFSFGDSAPDASEGHADADNEAFANFGNTEHVTFMNAQNGKKVNRRPTVSAEVYEDDEIDKFVPQVVEKEPEVKSYLMNLLERHNLFSHLEDFELSVAVDAMQEGMRSKGDTLYELDEEENDLMYVVLSGEIDLSVRDEHTTAKRGDVLNEINLLYPGRCKETAVCANDTTYYTLDRQTYKCVLSKASKKKRAMYEGFLGTVGFLKAANLSKVELLQLADALKPANFEPGATLIHYGEVGETFYLIVEGVVEVFGRDASNNTIKVCEFTVGDCVGELEFLKSHLCVADVKAKNFVRVAKMNRHHFEMVMGPVKEVLARTAQESTVYEYYRAQLEKMEHDGTLKAGDEGHKTATPKKVTISE